MALVCKVARGVVNIPNVIRMGKFYVCIQKRNSCDTCPPCPPCCTDRPYGYDCRKISHCLPQNDVCLPFECFGCIPSGVFRCTCGEVLGPSAGKCCVYQNPEYFALHHMSFYDIDFYLSLYRTPQINTGRKPFII